MTKVKKSAKNLKTERSIIIELEKITKMCRARTIGHYVSDKVLLDNNEKNSRDEEPPPPPLPKNDQMLWSVR